MTENEIINQIASCFEIKVDMNNIKNIARYLEKLEEENKQFKLETCDLVDRIIAEINCFILFNEKEHLTNSIRKLNLLKEKVYE